MRALLSVAAAAPAAAPGGPGAGGPPAGGGQPGGPRRGPGGRGFTFPFPIASYEALMVRAGIPCCNYKVIREFGQWIEIHKQ